MANPSPIAITQSEYEAVWKPQGWKILIIGPTSTWREEWGMWEAIRDIVQNSLDEAERYYYGYDKSGLWIADEGKGVAIADFLLGPPKLKPDWARGKFGEGMKIAALTLLRQGYPVHVETVGREIHIVFLEQEINGRVKTLAALWKGDGTQKGTKFHIIGYRGPAFQDNFAVNLRRDLILAEVPSPVTQPKQRYNQLIRAQGAAASPDGGIIYCRDIFLQGIDSPFSYNLWGFELAPDRHGPKRESDMWEDAGRLWAGITNVSLLAEFISMMVDPPLKRTTETNHVAMEFMGVEPVSKKRYSDIMVENRELWRQAWAKVKGKDAVILTADYLTPMVTHLEYRSVGVQWLVRNALENVIKTDAVLIGEMGERLREANDIPDKDLTPGQMAHLKLARALAMDFSQVGLIKASIIPPASDMVARTAGVYEFDTATIKIHTAELDTGEHTVGVMVHELAHHVAYQRTRSKEQAGDLTKAHADAMEFVAGRISHNLAEGRYDDILKDVIW